MRPTGPTWTARATARSPNSGSTSSSASQGRSPIAPSRSPSWTPASRSMHSPSARYGWLVLQTSGQPERAGHHDPVPDLPADGDGGARPGARAVLADHGLCRGHRRAVRARRLAGPQPDRRHRHRRLHRGLPALIGMRFAAKRSVQLPVGLLVAFGRLIGLAVAPTVAYYGSMDPRALWEA